MKRIVTTLCALAVIMVGSIPAMAAEEPPRQDASYNGILKGYRQNRLPVRALKAAWQHCVQEVERETAEINRKADALTKRKGNKNRER